MPSIKEFRLRIRSLQNTRKITSAMKLVASSKLKRAQGARAILGQRRHHPARMGRDVGGGVLIGFEELRIV